MGNNYIKELSYDSTYPSIQLPITKGGGSNTYITDVLYTSLQVGDPRPSTRLVGVGSPNTDGLFSYYVEPTENLTSRTYYIT